MQQPIKEENLDQFILSLSDFNFQQRYFKWVSFLRNLQKKQSQYYQAALEKFVEYYPFNFTYWIQLCQLYLRTGKGKPATLKMYQIALSKNPRCITLWQKYLQWLTTQISKKDPTYLRNEYQKATKIIGNHYKASFIFVSYFQMEKDLLKKYQMLKKAMVSPLEDIDRIFLIFLEFIQELQEEMLLIIAQTEKISVPEENKDISIKQQLKNIAKKLFEPTKQHVAIRSDYQSKICGDQYQPYTDSIENWRNYIQFIKNSGNTQFLPSVYQRALTNQSDNEALWQEYFLYLENQGNHNRALYLLRLHSTFIRNFSRELTYYWVQLEERQDPAHARQLYLQLQKQQYHLETYIRHIQLELRSKQFQNAKKIYESVLTVFTTNLSAVSFVVIQYAEFMLKYFRDLGFSKKLLRDYFEAYPFNEYLFIGYLQFYIKHVEYKQGTKEGKQVYDEFVQAILKGLKSIHEYCGSQYQRIMKRSKNLLRNYITSIYLLKSAQKKIKELQLNLKKTQETQALKRSSEFLSENNGNKKIKN